MKDNYLFNAVTELTKHGYKAYDVGSETYCFIVTPSDNVLYVQAEQFGGYNFSLQYRPSRECGTGCQCLEEPVSTIDLETVIKAEQEGLAFANRLHAPRWNNSEEWANKYWNKDKMTEIKSN